MIDLLTALADGILLALLVALGFVAGCILASHTTDRTSSRRRR